MPGVADKALDQFHKINRTSRQEFFWLNYLEPSLISGETGAGFTVLEEVVKTKNQDLVKHPMIKEMILTKWNQFGLFGVIYDISIYVLTLIAWSIMVLIRPLGSTIDSSSPFHLFIEMASLSFYGIQVYDELIEARIGLKKHRRWQEWKKRNAMTDLQYVTARNQNERSFLESMIDDIEGTTSLYFADYWNIYDCCSLTLMGITPQQISATLPLPDSLLVQTVQICPGFRIDRALCGDHHQLSWRLSEDSIRLLCPLHSDGLCLPFYFISAFITWYLILSFSAGVSIACIKFISAVFMRPVFFSQLPLKSHL
eukprot:sb/3467065/